MPSKKPVEISQLFGQAGQSQQIHQLKSQIEKLEAEITQLRANVFSPEEKAVLEQQIEQLTNQLATQGGVHEIAISLIDPDPTQPRQTFPPLIIQERAESLRRQGQQNPIVLIPQLDGRYKLFDGELRWRAAPLAEMTKLKAVFLSKEEIPDEVAVFEGQLVTSIHSQKLHDLDLATALIRLIIFKYPNFIGQEDEIPKFLNAFINRLVRSQKIQDLALIKDADLITQQEWLETSDFKEQEEYEIVSVLLGLQLNPVSVNNNIFPLLKVAEDLKVIIRSEGLESSKIRELNKLSAEQLKVDESQARGIRVQITQQVVQNKLSLSQTKTLVKQTLEKYNASNNKTKHEKQIDKTIKDIQSINLKSLEPTRLSKLHEVLKQTLHEIETLM
ncbi:ParB/RepB/Spo0J family partition protein [Nostoc sp. FACHB-87]|uniref:ParB/RepB/Spo0J family partition protein n=1 Tax=Nostocales TaxID=1161 RepID=UPI00168A1C0F|nr:MULTISPECIES: ParB/RepB/Spo0J family partition protein [Nostocales]MBD2459353.1 ParB/RepB/Spo0J family partition protein [Nostoc sp. FACHB-87]MBD2480341.1 ParB/RepB/Spo0J family partition protein [Anabaena sp. FACHB-83]MBD2492657.1 ParB/RepB/Spo0J family partition protein [Aulosira sp. FACHB-615]